MPLHNNLYQGNNYECIIWDKDMGRFKFFLTLSHDEDHRLRHVGIYAAKAGSTIHGVMTSYERALNLALRDVEAIGEVVADMIDQRYAPKGKTNDPDIPDCDSIPNFIAQRIVLDGYLTVPAGGVVL